MEVMDIKDIKLDIDCKDFNTVQEMLEGCDFAMVNYALTDDMKLIRTVTFFNNQEHNMESISASCNYFCQSQGNISISKIVMYKIFSFSKIKKSGIEFYSMLWKTITGFIPGHRTHDCRKYKRD